MKTKFEINDAILFIIDVQDKLANVMEEKESVIKNINILLEMSKLYSVEVIVTEQYPKGLGSTCENINIDREKVFIDEKVVFSAFTENVKNKLKELNKKTVILTGMETHICVFQTARELVDNGYKVFAIKDAICSRTNSNKENGLELIKLEGGIITNTETVLYDTLKVAGTEEFKILSKLIK